MLQGHADHDVGFLSHVCISEYQRRPGVTVNLCIQPPRTGEDPPRNVVTLCRYLAALKLGNEHIHDLPVKQQVSRAGGHDSTLEQRA